MIGAYILLGLWRCWLGGGIGKGWPFENGLDWVQYAALIALVYLSGTEFPLTNAIFLLILARGAKHSAMLRYPLHPGDNDYIYELVRGFPDDSHAQWWAYAGIRYIAPALVWGGALKAQGAGGWYLPAVGALCICVCYMATYHLREKLPVMTTPGDEAGNWSELVGWSLLGVALMGVG